MATNSLKEGWFVRAKTYRKPWMIGFQKKKKKDRKMNFFPISTKYPNFEAKEILKTTTYFQYKTLQNLD